MLWYWTDDVANVLLADSRIDLETAAELIRVPVAYRSEHSTLEEASAELAEEGEVPLAA